MTRIIAGFAGSLKLAVPPSGTRPTSDRVREAIFSSLEARDAIRGARVVDLYAGSGALGLEAASRGAGTVALVERASGAARVCKENVARVIRNAPADARPHITVAVQSVGAFLESGLDEWDLAFIDPPYDIDRTELSKILAALSKRLAPGAIVVLEQATKSGEPAWPAALALERSRTYGDTTLWWASAE